MIISTQALYFSMIWLIVATGTLNTNRKEVPEEVVIMKKFLDSKPRGTGYYFRAKE